MSSAQVDAHMAALPAERRAWMEAFRALVKAEAPEVEEIISYSMPGFRLRSRPLLSYAAFKHHYSLFAATQAIRDAAGDALAPYLTHKATISFPSDEAMPVELIRTIVRARIGEVLGEP